MRSFWKDHGARCRYRMYAPILTPLGVREGEAIYHTYTEIHQLPHRLVRAGQVKVHVCRIDGIGEEKLELKAT